jgi:hypothetical protein
MKVLFPQPDGPMIAVMTLRKIWKSTPLIAVRRP